MAVFLVVVVEMVVVVCICVVSFREAGDKEVEEVFSFSWAGWFAHPAKSKTSRRLVEKTVEA